MLKRRLLEDIEEELKVVEKVVGLGFEEFMADVRNRYTLRYAIIEIAETSTTIGLHILRGDFGVERVEGYTQVFDGLVEYGVISRDVGEGMKRLVRLRNLIVHRYWEVDDARIYKEARGSGLDVIRRFVGEVRGYASRV